jgi:hypothetical protein
VKESRFLTGVEYETVAIVCEFGAGSVKSFVNRDLLNCLTELSLARDGARGVLIVNRLGPDDPSRWIAATNGWIRRGATS